jgi:hypothetical protein
MWIEPRTRARTANAVGAQGEVVEPLSVVSTCVLSASVATEPVPAPVVALPTYVVVGGIRHVPIDALPWEVVTFRTICGQDVTADERVSGSVTDCGWCRRFDWH